MSAYEVRVLVEATDAGKAMALVGWALYNDPDVTDWEITRSAVAEGQS